VIYFGTRLYFQNHIKGLREYTRINEQQEKIYFPRSAFAFLLLVLNFLTTLIDFAMIPANWIMGIICLGPLVLLYTRRVALEDKMMADHFGEPYRAYLKRTGLPVATLGAETVNKNLPADPAGIELVLSGCQAGTKQASRRHEYVINPNYNQAHGRVSMKFQSKHFFLAVFLLISAIPFLTGCSSGQETVSPQIKSINTLRSALDLPIVSLEYVGTAYDGNYPGGNLQVAVYQDTDGRKYSVDPVSNRVVEMDARALLENLDPLTTSLSKEDLRDKALQIMKAVMPDFESLRTRWAYEEGGKGDNYFYVWADPGAPVGNRTYAQIAIHRSGLLFAYYNTLMLGK
jgi:hypothetical protein